MSRFEFKMPRLGESITDAAIITWFKNIGDTIEQDEMLLEVATDKVDSEVPSTVSGIVEEILFEANEVIKFIRRKAEGGAVKLMPQQNEGVEEGDLGAYRSNLQNTGNYPWTTYLGNKEKGESDKKQNIKDKEGFENEFKKSYAGQTIETTNGLYTFFDIKYKNNYGNYDLIFTKPKGENDWSGANLFITYDQTLGYYIDEYKGIKLTDADSEEKVIEMLSYNK